MSTRPQSRIRRNVAVAKPSNTWRTVKAVVISGLLVAAVLDINFGLRIGALVCAVLALSIVGRMRQPDKLAVAYAALAAFSLLWTEVPELSKNSTMNIAACVAIFLAVRAHVTSVRTFVLVASGLIVGSCISVLQLLQATNLNFRWTYDESATRLGIDGLGINYTAYALATTAAIVVVMIRLRSQSGRGLPRWVLLTALPLLYVGVLLNGTRAALLALALLLVWWAVARTKSPTALKPLIAGAIGINLLILLGWLDGEIAQRVIASDRETGDLNGRLTMWPMAREAFWDEPLLGHGVGALPGLPQNPLGINAHTAILDIGSGLGAVGVLLFGLIFWKSLAEACEWESDDSRFASGALLIASLPILLTGFWIESPVLWAALALFSRVSVYAEVAAASSSGSHALWVDGGARKRDLPRSATRSPRRARRSAERYVRAAKKDFS